MVGERGGNRQRGRCGCRAIALPCCLAATPRRQGRGDAVATPRRGDDRGVRARRHDVGRGSLHRLARRTGRDSPSAAICRRAPRIGGSRRATDLQRDHPQAVAPPQSSGRCPHPRRPRRVVRCDPHPGQARPICRRCGVTVVRQGCPAVRPCTCRRSNRARGTIRTPLSPKPGCVKQRRHCHRRGSSPAN